MNKRFNLKKIAYLFVFIALVPFVYSASLLNRNSIIAVIVAFLILLFLVMLLGKIIKGSKNKGYEKKEKKKDEDKKGEVPDFSEALARIEQVLREYAEEFNRFKAYCNDVLQTHHDHMNGGGYHGATNPPVSAEQWQRLFDSLNKLRSIDKEINDLFNAITTHKDFSRIKADQKQKLLNLTAERSSKISEMQNFYTDFWIGYNNAQPPRP